MVLAAVTQLTSTSLISENAALCCSLISRAASAGAKFVFLPEASDFIAQSDAVSRLANGDGGESTQAGKDSPEGFVQMIRETAEKEKVWVSVGVHEPQRGFNFAKAAGSSFSARRTDPSANSGKQRCFNTHLLINSCGSIADLYRKTHLFDVDVSSSGGPRIMESDTTVPGSAIPDPNPSTPVGSVGPLTCYDLRFPEISLSLRRKGAQVILYPSAFTVPTGAAHWEVLLRARAIETQCWVIAAAQTGAHPGTKRVSWGHAMIVDPWGSVVAQCSEPTTDEQRMRGTFALADIELDGLETLRRNMPLWSQRRNDIYPLI